MTFDDLNLTPGRWLAINCASTPSENNCQLLLAAPEDQKEDLIDAAAGHAADKHGHINDEKLHASIAGLVETIEVEPAHV
jgi:hypothetical protein